MVHTISVIVPVYNAEEYLSQTVESVLRQTYLHWELLLVDDCSSDRSVELAAAFSKKDPRIRWFPSSSNSGGPAGPRNRGIREAKGDFIAFLDADDTWNDRKLERQLEFFLAGDFDLVATNVIFFGAKISPWSPKLPRRPDLRSMLRRNRICTSSVLVRKKDDLVFDEDRLLSGVEDYHLWLRLLGNGDKVEILSEPLVHYRVTPQSLIHRNAFFSILKTCYAVLKVALEQESIDRHMAVIGLVAALKELFKLGIKKLWRR